MLVLQHGVGWSAELLRVSAPTFDAVATRYGLDRVASFQRAIPEKRPHWEKIVLLIHFLTFSPDDTVILWADADTLYLRPEMDPRNVLPTDCDIGFNRVKWGWWNAGLMFIRANSKTREFFSRVLDLGEVPGAFDNLQDEARINHELPAAKLAIYDLPPLWHSFERGEKQHENPIIAGWHGVARQTALKRMKEARKAAGV